MCMIDHSDPCDFLHTESLKARKPHRCGECYRTIRPGERYQRTRGKSDGAIFTAKTCTDCQEGCGWLLKQCGGYVFGGVYDDMVEHLSDWPSIMGEGGHQAMPGWMTLGRIIVRMRRRRLAAKELVGQGG